MRRFFLAKFFGVRHKGMIEGLATNVLRVLGRMPPDQGGRSLSVA